MLFSRPELIQLAANGQPDETRKDHIPVTKLFIRETGMVWLLTEIYAANPFHAYGLYDLADGHPCLGDIDLEQVLRMNNRQGLGVERDSYFVARKPISEYYRIARQTGYIIDVEIGNWKPLQYKM